MAKEPRSVISSNRLRGASALSFPTQIDAHVPNFFELRFVNYDRNATFENEKEQPNSVTIFLPVPLEITDTTSLSYEEYKSWGGLDAILQGKTSSDLGSAAKNFAGALGVGAARMGPIVAGNVLGSLGVPAAENIGQTASKIIGTSLGKTINPALAVEFKGVDRKKYQFSWRLIASSPQESTIINHIIDCIRWNSLPAREAGDWILTYPNIAMMKFHGNHSQSDPTSPRQIVQFGTQGAFIDNLSVSINGTAASQVFFVDSGEPVEVILSISAQDRGIVTREQVDSSWQKAG